MRCPYCVSEIADEALACPRCARDLYLFKPLLAKIEQLEKTVAEQALVVAASSLERIAAPEPRTGYGLAVTQAVIPALILLIAAHGLLLFVYDVKPLYLRVATILIPVPFGYLLALHYPVEFRKSVFAAAALAFAGVFSMLTMTAIIDKVPVLPQDMRDLRETLEYVLSIALAFVTGMLIGEYHARRKLAEIKSNRAVLLLARVFVPNEEGKLGIEKAVNKLIKLQEAVTSAAIGAASVYAGIKAFLGDLG